MEFSISTNGIDEPEVCAGIVRNLSPTFTDEPVCSAVEHHGVAHAQLFSEKRCLKVVGEVTDALEAGPQGGSTGTPAANATSISGALDKTTAPIARPSARA